MSRSLNKRVCLVVHILLSVSRIPHHSCHGYCPTTSSGSVLEQQGACSWVTLQRYRTFRLLLFFFYLEYTGGHFRHDYCIMTSGWMLKSRSSLPLLTSNSRVVSSVSAPCRSAVGSSGRPFSFTMISPSLIPPLCGEKGCQNIDILTWSVGIAKHFVFKYK